MMGEIQRRNDPSNTLPGQIAPFHWTFDQVEDRLIEAAACWRRSADRTAGWHYVRAFWPEGRPDYDWWFDYDARGGDGRSSDVRLRPLPLSRAEDARMMQASEWIGAHVPERDRALVCRVVMTKAAGFRPQWLRMLRPMGLAHGADGLRKRYTRAITAVAVALTAARVAVVEARI